MNTTNDSDDRKNDQRNPSGVWPALIDAIRSYSANQRAQAEKAKNPKSYNEGFWGMVTGVSTGIAAVLAFAAAIIFWSQLKEMQLEHRAWAYATPDFTGPISDDGKSLSVPITYTLENTGQSPAMRAWVASALFPLRQSETLAFQAEFCGAIRKATNMQSAQAHTIFPGEILSISRTEGIGRAVALQMMNKRSRANDLDFWLIGCVDYQVIGDRKHHQSGFIYDMARLIRQGPQFKIEMFRGDDPKKISPIPLILGGFDAD